MASWRLLTFNFRVLERNIGGIVVLHKIQSSLQSTGIAFAFAIEAQ